MDINSGFEFAQENNEDVKNLQGINSIPWKILSVEDDINYQESLIYAIQDTIFNTRPVEILKASSAAEAATILTQNPDIALVLLDVVMEEDDSGLRLVEFIRNVQGNSAIRIILLTGQPGFAPRLEVMQEYDIDEYWNKSEIQYDMLCSIVSAHLRTWHSLSELKQATLGLQMVVEAARSLSSKYDLDSFTHVVLAEISNVISASADGILCIMQPCPLPSNEVAPKATVKAATGNSTRYINCEFNEEIENLYGDVCRNALEQMTHQFSGHHSALFFPGDGEIAEYYLILVHTKQPLNLYNINLLQVFSENIANGFNNISFINRLAHLAYKDQQLNIYNRTWLQRELSNMSFADKNNTELVIFNVKQFANKALIFGEDHSNQLIKQLYDSICNVTTERHVITKMSADTFAILYNKNDAVELESLIALTNEPMVVHGISHNLDLTMVRMDLNLLSELHPDRILYLALGMLNIARKQRINILDYSPEYLQQITEESEIMHGLRNAIAESELFIELQPKVNMQTNTIIGFEALLRWSNQGVLISPARFIPVAEQSGLINQLDLFVFFEVVNALKALDVMGYRLPISFNATISDLRDEHYINSILTIIEQGEINPKLLDLEVTESQAMLDYEEINPILMRFREHGVNVSIDDFGTGYSSLAHIAQLAANIIKVDRTFITNIEDDEVSYHVVDMVMKLAQRFGFSVIAEGIETEGQKSMLLEHGCHHGQGYLFAKPMSLEKLLDWLPTQKLD
ncbi:EAL domain-containing protein [Psychrosphaera aquimarina]|uniref:EAL domain-containing protein n=1 Tax=Psychrosphaera aquimarina TaxID=2044854 RepID=A0ABU3R0H5_9GAMM|nr:EAL domain-containing protein [Psychrosphaera aquimarina]MDU0113177.1 EAL domain-containing protein [Psychrosphaera aquimarina]